MKRASPRKSMSAEKTAVTTAPKNAAPESAIVKKAPGGKRLAILSACSLLMTSFSHKSVKEAPVKKNIGSIMQIKGSVTYGRAAVYETGSREAIKTGHNNADSQNIKRLSILENCGKTM